MSDVAEQKHAEQQLAKMDKIIQLLEWILFQLTENAPAKKPAKRSAVKKAVAKKPAAKAKATDDKNVAARKKAAAKLLELSKKKIAKQK